MSNKNSDSDKQLFVTAVVDKKVREPKNTPHVGKKFYKYHIEYAFSNDGTCSLYRGIDESTRIPVWIKKFDVEDPTFLEYLKWEYQFLHTTNHPQLTKALDAITHGNDTYIVFEFTDGLSLKEILTEKRKLAWLDRIAIIYNVAKGLHVLNSAGIILHDLKPANIIVNQQSNEIKILYLGLENPSNKKKLRATLRNRIDESVMYLSPEQTEGRTSDRSNIFSLGVIAYQLFANKARSPFYSDNPFSCCYMIGSHEPLILERVINSKDVSKNVRKAISEIICCAMSKDEYERWQSTTLFMERLAQVYFAMEKKDEAYLNQALNFEPEIFLSGTRTKLGLEEKEQIKSLVLDIDNIDIHLPKAEEKVVLGETIVDQVLDETQVLTDEVPVSEKQENAAKVENIPKEVKTPNSIRRSSRRMVRATQPNKKLFYQIGLWTLVVVNVVILLILTLGSSTSKKDFRLLLKATKKLIEEEKYTQATRELQKITVLDPNSVDAHRELAKCYQYFNEYTKAISSYNNVLQKLTDAEAYHEKGNCYTNLQSYSFAISCYQKAINLKKDFALPYLGIAYVLNRTKQYQEAISQYNTALKYELTIDQQAETYFNIGLCYFKINKYNEAIDNYTKSIKLKPQRAYVYSNRAIAYDLIGKKELADQDMLIFSKLQIK